jgi:hypothetical protein
MRRGWRLFASVVGLLMVAGGVATIVATLTDSSTKSPAAMIVIALLLVGFGAFAFAGAKVERLVLYEDAAEFVGLLKGKRRVRRDEIAGFRLVPVKGYRLLVLELVAGKKPVKVEWTFETDPTLVAWFDAVPNLDMEDRAKAEAELLRSPALGANEAERARALIRARTIARALGLGSWLICMWGFVYPRPYSAAIVVLGALPLVALVALVAGPRLYAVEDGTRASPRSAFLLALMGPGSVLAWRAFRDLNVLDWKPLLVAASIGGLVIAAAIAMRERKRRLLTAAILLPLVSAYPWGALSLGNAFLDHDRPEVFRVLVRGKHATSGRYVSWNLELDPWGPVIAPTAVDVGRQVYDSASVGAPVCVELFPGAIGVRWYAVRRCPTAKSSP